MFVCVCACLSASITSELHVLLAFGCVAIRYILPVLWMTSCLQIMAKNRQREKLNSLLKMSRQGQHGFHIGVYTKRSTGGHHQIGGKGSQYSITESRVPELIPVLDSQPAGDVSHKPGGRLPLLSARAQTLS